MLINFTIYKFILKTSSYHRRLFVHPERFVQPSTTIYSHRYDSSVMKNFRYTIPKTPISVRVERTFTANVHCLRSCRAYRAMGIVIMMTPSTRKSKTFWSWSSKQVKQVFLNFFSLLKLILLYLSINHIFGKCDTKTINVINTCIVRFRCCNGEVITRGCLRNLVVCVQQVSFLYVLYW